MKLNELNVGDRVLNVSLNEPATITEVDGERCDWGISFVRIVLERGGFPMWTNPENLEAL